MPVMIIRDLYSYNTTRQTCHAVLNTHIEVFGIVTLHLHIAESAIDKQAVMTLA